MAYSAAISYRARGCSWRARVGGVSEARGEDGGHAARLAVACVFVGEAGELGVAMDVPFDEIDAVGVIDWDIVTATRPSMRCARKARWPARMR